jgi:serine phosphatase RsbU (regulator of sigma subunit)
MASVCVVSAGHPRPIVLAEGLTVELDVPAGPPIGIDTASRWNEVRFELPGRPWSLLLYTDGLVEGRRSPDGPRPYGDERLLAVVEAMQAPLDDADLDAILSLVRKANGGPMPDDVVILAVSPA